MEKRIYKFEDKSIEIMQSEEQRKKEVLKMSRAPEKCGTPTYI